MKTTNFICLSFFLTLALAPLPAQGEGTVWEAQREAAQKAFAAGDMDTAEREWRSALTSAEQSAQVEPGLVTCLVGLAFVNDKRGDPKEAERLYELAMRNMEGFVGPTSTRFADWMPALAFMYDAHGKPDKAEVLFKRALLIKRNSFGPNDVRVAEAMEGYARFLRHNDRHAEASDFEQKARVIRQKLPQ